MRLRLVTYSIVATIALAISCMISIPVAAQDIAPPPPAPGAGAPEAGGRGAAAAAMAAKMKEAAAMPTPHTADGHPDLNGTWAAGGFGGGGGNAQGPVFGPDGSTIRPVAGAEEDEIKGDTAAVARRAADTSARPSYKPEFQGTAQEYFVKAAHFDPSYRCEPLGVPRMGAPAEIVQTPTAVYFLYAGAASTPNMFRVIPTDGRQHDKDAEPMANGDAVGHWEGDTLVVDVTSIDTDTWIDGDGSFHDKNLHVVERLTRQGNTLRYEATVEDPTLFTKPFITRPRTLMIGKPGSHAAEDYPCVEQDQTHLTSDERH